MQQRVKYRRHSKKHNGASVKSPSPKEPSAEKTRPKERPSNSSSPAPNLRKIRSHARNQNTRKDWVADWENQSSSASPYESPTGLLHVRTRSGWTSQTWLSSQSEELDPVTEPQKAPQKENSRDDFEEVLPQLMFARMELQQLYAENGTKRNQLIAQLQDLITQRDKLNKELNPEQGSENTAEITTGKGKTQMWITAEMDRLANEFDFKANVAELLRTTLVKTKAQRTHLQSALELKAVLLDAQPETSLLGAGKSTSENKHHRDLSSAREVKEMEKEIAALEGHLKLLNDALDDEKQENYELAHQNSMLRKEAMHRSQKPQKPCE